MSSSTSRGTRILFGGAEVASANARPATKRVCLGGRGREWAAESLRLLEAILELDDAKMFLQPMDPLRHHDYYALIPDPIDLSKILLKFHGGSYSNLSQFTEDMRRMFDNYQLYFSRAGVQGYSQVRRLAAWYEAEIKRITTKWFKAFDGPSGSAAGGCVSVTRAYMPRAGSLEAKIQALERDNLRIVGPTSLKTGHLWIPQSLQFPSPAPPIIARTSSPLVAGGLPNFVLGVSGGVHRPSVAQPHSGAPRIPVIAVRVSGAQSSAACVASSTTTASIASLLSGAGGARTLLSGGGGVGASFGGGGGVGTLLSSGGGVGAMRLAVPQGSRPSQMIFVPKTSDSSSSINPTPSSTSGSNSNVIYMNWPPGVPPSPSLPPLAPSAPPANKMPFVLRCIAPVPPIPLATPPPSGGCGGEALVDQALRLGADGRLALMMDVTNVWFGTARNKPTQPVIVTEEGFSVRLRFGDSELPFTIGASEIVRCSAYFGNAHKHTLFLFVVPNCTRRLLGVGDKFASSTLIVMFLPALTQAQIASLVYLFWRMGRASVFGDLFGEVDQKGALLLLANIKPAIVSNMADRLNDVTATSNLAQTSTSAVIGRCYRLGPAHAALSAPADHSPSSLRPPSTPETPNVFADPPDTNGFVVMECKQEPVDDDESAANSVEDRDLEIVVTPCDSETESSQTDLDARLSPPRCGVMVQTCQEDVVMLGGTVNIRCPITQRVMVHPLRNSVCGHCYDRQGVEQLIKHRAGKARCPVQGCSNARPLTMKDLKHEYNLWQYIQTKI